MKKIFILIVICIVVSSCEDYETMYKESQQREVNLVESLEAKEETIKNISAELQDKASIQIRKDSIHLVELRETRRKLDYYKSSYLNSREEKDRLTARGISSLTVDERRRFISENLDFIIKEFNIR